MGCIICSISLATHYSLIFAARRGDKKDPFFCLFHVYKKPFRDRYFPKSNTFWDQATALLQRISVQVWQRPNLYVFMHFHHAALQVTVPILKTSTQFLNHCGTWAKDTQCFDVDKTQSLVYMSKRMRFSTYQSGILDMQMSIRRREIEKSVFEQQQLYMSRQTLNFKRANNQQILSKIYFQLYKISINPSILV